MYATNHCAESGLIYKRGTEQVLPEREDSILPIVLKPGNGYRWVEVFIFIKK